MVGIIVNPRARAGRDPALPRRLEAELRAAGVAGEVRVTRSPADLEEAARAFAAAGVAVVGVCGGDGTSSATLAALGRCYRRGRLPVLLLLRGGTINTVARNLGVRGRPELLLRRALRHLAQGPEGLPLWRQDLLSVHYRRYRSGADAPPDLCGFLFAAAMGARFLHAYYQTAPQPGLGQALLLMGRTIGSTMVPGGGRLSRRLFAQTPIEVEADGERLPAERFRMLVCSTVPDVGLGMRVAWQAGRSARRLHLVASALPIGSMARQLHRVFRGQPLSGPREAHVDRLVERVRLRFPASEEPFTLDGDLYLAREIEIALGPQIGILL